MSKYEWFKGADGYRWRLKSRNGKILASGEGYQRKAGVLAWIAAHRRAAMTTKSCRGVRMIQALIAVAIALAALLGLQTVRLANEQAAHSKTDAACKESKRVAAEELAAATTEARQKERALQTQANLDRREADEAIKGLVDARNMLRAIRLRNKADAAKLPTAPEPAGTAQTTPEPDRAELSGATGSAEEDEALRADIIRVELQSCYRAYERAAGIDQIEKGGADK